MARKILEVLIDDLTGDELDESGETIGFSLDGNDYEIDLSAANAATLRDTLRVYVDAARKVQKDRQRVLPADVGAMSASAKRRRLNEVRIWARENGHDVSDRGRVPNTVIAAYDKAH